MALKAAAPKCDPVLLEPIMKVEITVPEQYYGDVIGDVARRRGNMTGETQRGNAKQIDAEIRHREPRTVKVIAQLSGKVFRIMMYNSFGELCCEERPMGSLAVSAITSCDYNLIQGYVLWVALIYMVINLIVDMSYHYVDPRMRIKG